MLTQRASLSDLLELQFLFVETIRDSCKLDYAENQIQAWTSSINNHKRWNDILKNQIVLICKDENRITGFCTLKNGFYIDMLFVHKNYQKRGIAKTLFLEIEAEAIQQKQSELVADVSITAKPFFLKMGFVIVEEQTVKVKGIKLINFKMRKSIFVFE